MFRRFKKENKAKLEHKLYLARENPDPIFDISSCDLQNVPSGIYSLCRVFLKEHLSLADNNLSTLNGGGCLGDLKFLKILSINNNAFTNLPDDIHLLINLKELYIQDNQIKKLPSALCRLLHLQILNVSNNLLKDLPSNMGNLSNLKVLNVIGNEKLKELPRSLCNAQCLKCIHLDKERFIYPPQEIINQDVNAIMKFLCDDNGVEYSPKEEININSNEKPSEDSYTNLEAKIWELEKIKEQKLQDFLAIERHNELMQRQELEVTIALKVNREKLLADLTEQQQKFDESLDKFQQIKELDRFRLIEQLREVEANADIAVRHLLKMSKEPLSVLLEQEAAEQERIIAAANKHNENLCKSAILHSMEELLEKEKLKFLEYDKFRSEYSKSVLEQDLQNVSHLLEVFREQDDKNKELASQLNDDSDLQKVAVAALLEKGDARSWSLVQQVKLVESQLAALTVIELDRKKLEIDQRMTDLAEKRINLSILLVDLLEQQNMRRSQLLFTLHSLEEENMEKAEDYWLRQYQHLLDSMPEGFCENQRNMDPALMEALLIEGVLNYLPFLAKASHKEDVLLEITDEGLYDLGIKNSNDRSSILHAIELYRRHNNSPSHIPHPSAPSNTEYEASAPTVTQSYSTSECVICMDHKCEIIYVPCGHFCSCTNCCMSLTECPMCRTTIERQIRMDLS